MPELPPEVEQQLSNLSDGEWSALTARLRAPDSVEAFRTAAAKHVSGDALVTIVATTDVSKFAGDDGQIDESKVAQHLGRLFPQPAGAQPNWGQSGGGPAPGLHPGDRGRAEAAKRAGKQLDPETAAALGKTSIGVAGRTEAQRRQANRRAQR